MSVHLKEFCNITINHKKIARIKQKYDIRTQYRRAKVKRQTVPDAKTLGITNLIKNKVAQYPNHIWSCDFTYLFFQNKWQYLATIKDNFTKEILASTLSDNHNQELVINTFNKARIYGFPMYLHSDQGSEYRSANYLFICKQSGIQISMSAKGRPTENGCQESFYSYFKLELGNINRFNTYQELEFSIGKQIHYYNNNRIHSVIRTSPARFRSRYNTTIQITYPALLSNPNIETRKSLKIK
jgi:putative transposase